MMEPTHDSAFVFCGAVAGCCKCDGCRIQADLTVPGAFTVTPVVGLVRPLTRLCRAAGC